MTSSHLHSADIYLLGMFVQEITTDLFPKHMWDIFGMHALTDEDHGIDGDKTQRAHDLLLVSGNRWMRVYPYDCHMPLLSSILSRK